ncbi:MAG: imidazolonepropionase [Desulfobacteraceae bacterium]|nr:imidazolonepropionase [Desulfobacteraceae bacterium]
MKQKPLLICNAAQIVTNKGKKASCGKDMASLTIIEDGALIIEDGVITAVGPTDEVTGGLNTDNFDVIDATGKAVLPGFVDSHTHFPFGGYRPEEYSWRLTGVPYMQIMERGGGIINTMSATRKASKPELMALGRKRLDDMLAMGITTVEGKSGYGLDLETELKQLDVMAELNNEHSMDVVSTFLGAHAVPPEYKGRADDYIDYVADTVLPQVVESKLAQCCDVFCEKNVFSVAQSRRLLQKAKDMGLELKLHADEIVSLGGAQLAAELGALSADHLLQATDQGMDAMAESGVVATLLPGTAFSLKETYARGREMIKRGCAVALATDFNPGSCFTFSVPLILSLATLHVGLTPEEALTAMTLNGAAAVGRSETTGSLEVGKAGDAVILSYPSYLFLTYHIGINIVEKVIKNGKLVVDRS